MVCGLWQQAAFTSAWWTLAAVGRRRSVKASLPTLKVGKEALTTSGGDTYGQTHHQPRRKRVKGSFPKYMKDPFLYLGARMGAFMYSQGHRRQAT